MADAEYFIQLFLFGATLFCYILLLIFILYGAYYCCLRSCLKVRRRRQLERKQEGDPENTTSSFRGHAQLINPFQTNNKVTIVSHSNASPSQRLADDTAAAEDSLNSNTEPLNNNPNHFVDKKYYDIFVA